MAPPALTYRKAFTQKELKLNRNQKTEPTINGKTARELALIKFKSGYEDGTIIAQQQHMCSALGAISFAFFLALFSATTDALSKPALITSEIFFSVSLVSNILLSFFTGPLLERMGESMSGILKTRPTPAYSN